MEQEVLCLPIGWMIYKLIDFFFFFVFFFFSFFFLPAIKSHLEPPVVNEVKQYFTIQNNSTGQGDGPCLEPRY